MEARIMQQVDKFFDRSRVNEYRPQCMSVICSLTQPHLCPNSYARYAPADTMALSAPPTIPSNLTPEQAFEYDTTILHASSLEAPNLTLQYWITTRSILPTFTQDHQEADYDVLYFKSFSTEAAWTRLYPNQPISNTISV